MSTIGGLYLPKFETPDMGRAMNQGILGGANIIHGQTSLLALEDLKRQQEAQAQVRAYFAAHHEAALGGGGESVLGALGPAGGPPGGGPLLQQTMMPGQPPGAPQVVPGGQDLSRYADVSPQGGGPIPPGMAAQMMPTVTPPQSTLGSLGPQADPLEQLMRHNPDAAFQVMLRQQQQEDVRLKRDEARVSTGTKVLEYVARLAQGVTDQAGLDAMRQGLSRLQLHQYAAQLPQVYSKEAMLPFINTAVSVKDNALLRLETWKNQIEMQKAGLQGEPAAMVSELRTMGVNPLQATTDQRRQAQVNIQQRELEQKEREGYAGKQADITAQREARQTQTLSEAFKGDTVNLYDTQTGRPLPARMKVADYEQMPQNRVTQLSEDNRKQMENLNAAMPRLQILQQHIDSVYGEGGVLARMTPDDRELITRGTPLSQRVLDQFAQKYPELVAAQKYIDANAESLARALSGVRGAATEGDVERAKAMLPNLTTSLQVWPLSKIGVNLPDTRATALRTMNNLTETLNGIGTAILGNAEYRTPLKTYEMATPASPTAPASAGPNPRLAPVPAAPTPQPTSSGPTPAPGQPLFPRPQMRIPGEGPAPALPEVPGARPAPPTATSTPAQDEAYRQSQGQGTAPTPAPSSPAPRPAPGRQSQAPAVSGQTRVARAGGPKFMNQSDVVEAMRQTGKSRAEVEKAARAKGYTVYGSALPLPGASRMAQGRTTAQGENQQLAAMINTIAEQAQRRGEDPGAAVQRWAQSVGIA